MFLGIKGDRYSNNKKVDSHTLVSKSIGHRLGGRLVRSIRFSPFLVSLTFVNVLDEVNCVTETMAAGGGRLLDIRCN